MGFRGPWEVRGGRGRGEIWRGTGGRAEKGGEEGLVVEGWEMCA